MTPCESNHSKRSWPGRPESVRGRPAASAAMKRRPAGERRNDRTHAPSDQPCGSTAANGSRPRERSPASRGAPPRRAPRVRRAAVTNTALPLSARAAPGAPADAATSASENGQAAPNTARAETQQSTAEKWGDRDRGNRTALTRERTDASGGRSGARHAEAAPDRGREMPNDDIARLAGAPAPASGAHTTWVRCGLSMARARAS